MKKFSFLIMLFIISLGVFVGCSCNSNPTVEFMVDNHVYFKMEFSDDSEIVIPETPTKAGYKFKGWYLQSSGANIEFNQEYLDTHEITKKIRVVSKWELENYNINYNLSIGGENNPNNIIKYTVNDVYRYFEAPVRIGYKFNGWYLGEEEHNSISNTDYKDLDLVAKWTPIYDNTIILKDNIATIKEVEDLLLVPISSETKYIDKLIIVNKDNKLELNFNKIYAPLRVNKIVVVDSQNNIMNNVKVNIGELLCYGCERDQEVFQKPLFSSNIIITKASVIDSAIFVSNMTSKITQSKYEDRDNFMVIVLPNSINGIEQSAFENCDNLIDIYWGNSITYIGDRAFWGCISLREIYLPGHVKFIGIASFASCSNLEKIVLSEKITIINNGAFSNCKKLNNIIIPSSITMIDSASFMGCISLSTITLNEGLLNIGESAFDGCYGLINVVLPDSLTRIDPQAFYDCANLLTIKVGKGLQTIGYNAFYKCSNLIEVINTSNLNITKGGRTFGKIAMYAKQVISSKQDSNLQTIDNSHLMYVDGNDNYYVRYLGTEKNVVLPTTTYNYSINHGAFLSDNIESITFTDNVVSIGESAFESCGKLQTITLPNSITSLGKSCFAKCTSLTQITIPTSINTIPFSAFYMCESLSSINLPQSIHTIENSAFERCIGLKEVVLPSNLTFIGANSFARCRGLEKIVLPENIKSIGDWAFLECDNLVNIIIPSKVEYVGYQAFVECPKLQGIFCDIEKPLTVPQKEANGEIVWSWNEEWASNIMYEETTHKIYWKGEWTKDSFGEPSAI